MKISYIVARDLAGGIGLKNSLPWHIPADLQYFKSITSGKPIIMGRKTFESLFEALPNRLNIVVSSGVGFNGALRAETCEQALALAKTFLDDTQVPEEDQEVLVIGGGAIYKAFETMYDKAYITQIHCTHLCDTFYHPTFISKDGVLDDTWELVSEEYVEEDVVSPSHTRQIFENKQFKLKL